MVGTFHAVGRQRRLRPGRAGRAVAGRAPRRAVRRVGGREGDWPSGPCGGDYELLFNGIEIERFAKATPAPSSGPTIFFVGRHEPRKGLAVLLDALRHLPSDVSAVGRRRRARRPRRCAPVTAATPASSGSDASATTRRRRGMRGADVFCAPSLHGESFGVVLLEAMAAGAVVVASALDGYGNVATRGRRRGHATAGRQRRAGDGARRGALRRRAPAPAGRGRRATGPEFSMVRLAEAYIERYERLAPTA